MKRIDSKTWEKKERKIWYDPELKRRTVSIKSSTVEEMIAKGENLQFRVLSEPEDKNVMFIAGNQLIEQRLKIGDRTYTDNFGREPYRLWYYEFVPNITPQPTLL